MNLTEWLLIGIMVGIWLIAAILAYGILFVEAEDYDA